jgi:hypothetical protein
MSGWIGWLGVPANQGIVTTVISVLTLVLAVVAYLRPRSPKEKADQIVHAREHSRGQRQKPISRRTYPMIVGVLALLGVAYGLYVWLKPEVKIFRVCMGESANECQIPHEIFLGCNGNIENWANSTCRSHTSVLLNTHAGNQCGYTTVQITCVMK